MVVFLINYFVVFFVYLFFTVTSKIVSLKYTVANEVGIKYVRSTKLFQLYLQL